MSTINKTTTEIEMMKKAEQRWKKLNRNETDPQKYRVKEFLCEGEYVSDKKNLMDP